MRTVSLFLFSLVLFPILFTACTTGRDISVQMPAEIAVPTTASRMVLMDRTAPRTGFSNAFESIASRESRMDRDLGQRMNTVLKEALLSLGRFDVVIEPGRFVGSGTGVLPEPLSWDTIIQVCSRNEADILVALEALDTDVNIDVQERTVQNINSNGKPSGPPKAEFQAKRKTTVRYGWRVYDGRAKTITDMFNNRSVAHDEYVDRTKQLAKQGMPDKQLVVEGMALDAAKRYAERYAPTSATVRRKLYTGGDRRLSDANVHIGSNNWRSAMDIWESMLTDPKVKLRGKACYNIAVANEVLGDLPKAQECAERATTEFGNKWGKGYAAELDVRMKNEMRARTESEQMGAD